MRALGFFPSVDCTRRDHFFLPIVIPSSWRTPFSENEWALGQVGRPGGLDDGLLLD